MLINFNYSRAVFYISIFSAYCFFNTTVASNSDGDIFIDTTLNIRTRLDSSNAAIKELQRRSENGDNIAKQFFKNALHNETFQKKLEVINNYNIMKQSQREARRILEEDRATMEASDSSNAGGGGSYSSISGMSIGLTPLKKLKSRNQELEEEKKTNQEILAKIAAKLGTQFTSPQKKEFATSNTNTETETPKRPPTESTNATPSKRTPKRRIPAQSTKTDELVGILDKALLAKGELEEKYNTLQAQFAEVKQKAQNLSPLKKQVSLMASKNEELTQALTQAEGKEKALQEEIQFIKSQMGGDTLDGILAEKPNQSSAIGLTLSNLSDIDPLELELASYYGKIKKIKEKIDKYEDVCNDYERVKFLHTEAIKLIEIKTEIITEKQGKKEVTREIKRHFIRDEALGIESRLNQNNISIADDYSWLGNTNLENASNLPAKNILELMQEASEIANKYKPTDFLGKEVTITVAGETITKKSKGIKEKMEEASPEVRVELMNNTFLNVYIENPSNEMIEIQKMDFLQTSLKITKLFEESIKKFSQLKIYPESEIASITGIISKAQNDLQNNIKKKDKETYENYQAILVEERNRLNTIAEQENGQAEFRRMPMTLQLLRTPMAFFMLEIPNPSAQIKPFNTLERVEGEITYLSEVQKKSLFAYLYYIVYNFEETSKGYLNATLRSRTPIKLENIYPLIEILKDALKTNPNASIFEATATTEDKLSNISISINNLLSGKTYHDAAIQKISTTFFYLKQCLNGITREALELYKSSISKSSKNFDVINNILLHWETLEGNHKLQEIKTQEELTKLLSIEKELSKSHQELLKNLDLIITLSKINIPNNENAPSSENSQEVTTSVEKRDQKPSHFVTTLIQNKRFTDTVTDGKNRQTQDIKAGKYRAADVAPPPKLSLLDQIRAKKKDENPAGGGGSTASSGSNKPATAPKLSFLDQIKAKKKDENPAGGGGSTASSDSNKPAAAPKLSFLDQIKLRNKGEEKEQN